VDAAILPDLEPGMLVHEETLLHHPAPLWQRS
jgi:hypothetical protein